MGRLAKNVIWLGLLAAGIALAWIFLLGGPEKLPGPESSGGFKSRVSLRNQGIPGLVSGSFNADVEVLDAQGNLLCTWEDKAGRRSRTAAEEMLKTLKWVGPTALAFQTEDVGRGIERKADGTWTAR
jgi:hypothetical protein